MQQNNGTVLRLAVPFSTAANFPKVFNFNNNAPRARCTPSIIIQSDFFNIGLENIVCLSS